MTLSHQANGFPTTGDYEFASDLGVNSIAGVVALARTSGIPFTVGSTYRNEIGSWHFSHNAADLFATNNDMNRLAQYLLQYAHYLGELLHTPRGAKQATNGRWSPVYAVDNGQILQSLSDGVARQHFDHVHLAATNSGLVAAAKAQPQLYKRWVLELKKQGVDVPVTQNTGTPAKTTGATGAAQSSLVSADAGVITSTDTRPGCLIKGAAMVATVAPLATILHHYL